MLFKNYNPILVFFSGVVWLTLFSNSVFAQNCLYEKNEIDAVTELAVKRTVPEILLRINGQPVFVKAQSIGDNKYLKIQYYRYSNYEIQENREITFVLTTEEQVTLFPREMPVDSTKMNDFSDLSSLLIFKLSTEQYQKLKETPITVFKYHLISGFVEEPLKGGKQKSIMEVLRCIE